MRMMLISRSLSLRPTLFGRVPDHGCAAPRASIVESAGAPAAAPVVGPRRHCSLFVGQGVLAEHPPVVAGRNAAPANELLPKRGGGAESNDPGNFLDRDLAGLEQLLSSVQSLGKQPRVRGRSR